MMDIDAGSMSVHIKVTADQPIHATARMRKFAFGKRPAVVGDGPSDRHRPTHGRPSPWPSTSRGGARTRPYRPRPASMWPPSATESHGSLYAEAYQQGGPAVSRRARTLSACKSAGGRRWRTGTPPSIPSALAQARLREALLASRLHRDRGEIDGASGRRASRTMGVRHQPALRKRRQSNGSKHRR